MRSRLFPPAVAVICMTAGAATAATATTSFIVQMKIKSECAIGSVDNLTFKDSGVLGKDVDASGFITVVCTKGTAYNIGLDAGKSAGATTAKRSMTGKDGAIGYNLYRESGRTTVWGDKVGTDTVAGTGIGKTERHEIYGRVPPQNSPPAGDYSDTITVTVTY